MKDRVGATILAAAVEDKTLMKGTFGQAAQVIGVVSGVLGIIQAWRDVGSSIVSAIWDGLYYAGFIGAYGFIAYVLMASLLGHKGDDLQALRRSRIILIPALAAGAIFGLWFAGGNLQQRESEGGVHWSKSKAIPPNAMRVLGALCIVLPLAWRFLPERGPQAPPEDPPAA
ncbi:MAG TPA: hypothetical protein VM328_09400 [Fimbriimonadaceae bacterium]|nr:hypothetical protein [Fimbriimonadaceae bacterium]